MKKSLWLTSCLCSDRAHQAYKADGEYSGGVHLTDDDVDQSDGKRGEVY